MSDKVVSIHPDCDYEEGENSEATFDVSLGVALSFAENNDIPLIVLMQDSMGDSFAYATSAVGRGNTRKLNNLFVELMPVPIEDDDE